MAINSSFKFQNEIPYSDRMKIRQREIKEEMGIGSYEHCSFFIPQEFRDDRFIFVPENDGVPNFSVKWNCSSPQLIEHIQKGGKVSILGPKELIPEGIESVPMMQVLAKMHPEIYDDGIQLIPSNEFEFLDIPSIDYDIENTMYDSGLSIYMGESGSCKTLLLLNMALCLSCGRDFLTKYPSKQKRVLYINEENALPIMKPYIENVRNGMFLKKNEGSTLQIATFQNLAFDFIRQPDKTKLLCNQIIKSGAKTVILDSLKGFIDFEENNADHVRDWYNKSVKPLLSKFKIHLIVIAHTKKANDNPHFKVNKLQMLRGSIDFGNVADNVFFFEKVSQTPKIIRILHVKARGAPEKDKVLRLLSDKEAKQVAFEEIEDRNNESLAGPIKNIYAEPIFEFFKDSTRDTYSRQELIMKLVDTKKISTEKKLSEGLKYLTRNDIVHDSKVGKQTMFTINRNHEIFNEKEVAEDGNRNDNQQTLDE